MPDEFRTRWEGRANKIRLLLARLLRETQAGRQAIAEILELVEQVDEDVRHLPRRNAGSGTSPVKAVRNKPKRYAVEERRRGEVLCEYRKDAAQPFCCSKEAYDAAAAALAGLKKPASYEEIHAKVVKVLKSEPSPYTIRVCLRCLRQEGLINRHRARYFAAEPERIQEKAASQWRRMTRQGDG